MDRLLNNQALLFTVVLLKFNCIITGKGMVTNDVKFFVTGLSRDTVRRGLLALLSRGCNLLS